jgi:hypothetical protein
MVLTYHHHHHYCLNLQTSRQRQLCSRSSSSSSWMITDSLWVVEDVLIRTVRRLGPVAVAQQSPPLRGGWGGCCSCSSEWMRVWVWGLFFLPPSDGQLQVLSRYSPSLLLHVTSVVAIIITFIERLCFRVRIEFTIRLIIVRGNEVPKVCRWDMGEL